MNDEANPDFCLAAATIPDYEEVMLMEVYEGMDYLGHCYHAWLDEEARDPTRRKNLLLKV